VTALLSRSPRFGGGGGPATTVTRGRRDTIWAVVLLLPLLVVFGWFAVYPFVYEMAIGLRAGNFGILLDNPIYTETVRNTVVFVLIAVNIKMLLALLLSGLMVSRSRVLRWATAIAIIPWMLPDVVSLLSARWMLNSQSGLLNKLLDVIGIAGPSWLDQPGLALGSAIAMHIWKLMPFWALTLLAARLAIPTNLYEAAALDGANMRQIFRYITWPRIAGVYLACTVLASIWAVGEFNSVFLITGGGPADSTQVLATLGVSYAFDQANPPLGASVVLTALPALIVGIIYLIRRTVKGGSLL
jgi:multiple sugar transport system permease protein